MEIKFASYGNSKKFYEKYESSLDAPRYIASLGLDGYEYLCNQGVHISDDACLILKENAIKNNIALSVRAYDFLSLSHSDEETRRKSVDILYETARAANIMGAERVVFPLDNCAIRARKDVFSNTKKSLFEALSRLKADGIENVYLCPEAMGLIHDLGTVDEVISLCLCDERILPAINAGNIYARSQGRECDTLFYEKLIDKLHKKLGAYRGDNFHLYYSKVEYTHHGFREDINFFECEDENQSCEGLFKAVKNKKITPFVVCKSPDTQDTDCVLMKEIYKRI